jgi:ABC-2 type transport system ATP-binding protein
MSLLEVKGLTRDFGMFRAVSQVELTLDAGVIMGFIGPNGAGKTTTMRILATLDSPTSGDVKIDGHSAVDQPDAVRPLIGYMPDRYGTYDDVTVYEFLDFFARAYGLKAQERRARIASVMDFTKLFGLRDKLTSELSKGMRQRVALGRTLLHDPKLLILDEPADGLDPRARIELRELLKVLADQGKAILISSHILSELAEMIDTCAIIEQGKLLAVGPVSEIVAKSGSGGSARELVLRLAGEDAQAPLLAERTLLEQPGVAEVLRDGRSLRLRVKPPDEAGTGGLDALAARLLQALVAAGLPVCSFHLHEVDLEDAFMRVTRGKVA